jgi:acylphosphatase
MITRADVRFRGRVQGVHFRNFTRKYAKRLQVSGWVRNLPDGSVEALFEGEDGAINEVIRMLTEEQPYAQVEHVDVIWSRPLNEFPNFEIH